MKKVFKYIVVALIAIVFLGTFVFLFRNEEWRYDKAESFRVMIGDKSWQFRNAPGQTNEKTVAVYLKDGSEPTVFRKEG